MDAAKQAVRLAVGLTASGALIYLSYLSLKQHFTLDPAVIVGMLALITLMVYGVGGVETLIDSWRGGGD